MKKILQGIVIGIANIIPGVSGGTMMVAMGIYDKLIHSITHLRKEFKESMKFLIPDICRCQESRLLLLQEFWKRALPCSRFRQIYCFVD